MKDGKGTLTSANHSVYTGKFYQDKKHGKGEMTQGAPDSKKVTFLEQWKYGVLVNRRPKDGKLPTDNLSMRSDNMMNNRSVIVDAMRPNGGLLDSSQASLNNQ